MKLNEEQSKEFTRLSRALMDFLQCNCKGQCSVIVTGYDAELVETKESVISIEELEAGS